MVREELYFPFGATLLAAAALSVVLIYLDVVPYSSQFSVLIFTVVSFALSVVLLALHLVSTRPLEEPYSYEYHLLSEKALEHSENQTVARTVNPRKAKAAIVDPPTREELQRLKEALGISEGSLQFKARGGAIYLVTYKDGKHYWKHFGLWIQLREKLGLKRTVE